MWKWIKWVLLGMILLIVVLFLLNALKNKTGNTQTVGRFADDGQFLSNGRCEGNEKPPITHLPMRQEDFAFIIPYGLVIDDHVTPIDHQYFQPTDFSSATNAYPVYAMADAKLVSIGKRNGYKNDTEYRLIFSMSCRLFYYYDLVTALTPEIEKELGGKEYAGVNIPVKAGQQIGAIGGRTLDFAVWDMDIKLSGLLVPEHYQAEPWKIHTADPLIYYTNELKAKTTAKYLRAADPASGKIDYDIDDKLIGSWFLEGIGGFGNMDNPNPDNYKGHFSFIPNHIDPTSFVFSIGDYKGEPSQFGVNGNSPDPTTIDVSSGLVKYELVELDWIDETGNRWNRNTFAKGLKAANGTQVYGVALIQMTEGRKLKLEVFPNKTANDVSGFTSNAKMYER